VVAASELAVDTAPVPTLRHALGAVVGTAIDQVRDLTVAQLDCWATRLRARLTEDPHGTEPATSGLVRPLLIGALAGAVLAWWLADRQERA
jgi:hypothetical protein